MTHSLTVVRADLSRPTVPFAPNYEDGWLGPALLAGRIPSLPACSGLTLHRQAADAVFPLPAVVRFWGDKVVRERAALLAGVRHITTPLGLYRVHSGNLTGMGAARTLPAVERALEMYEHIWADRAEFARRELGLEPQPEQWAGEAAVLRLTKSALTGERFSVEDLRAFRHPLSRWYWKFLLRLPPASSSRAIRWFWADTAAKRIAYMILRTRWKESHA